MPSRDAGFIELVKHGFAKTTASWRSRIRMEAGAPWTLCRVRGFSHAAIRAPNELAADQFCPGNVNGNWEAGHSHLNTAGVPDGSCASTPNRLKLVP